MGVSVFVDIGGVVKQLHKEWPCFVVTARHSPTCCVLATVFCTLMSPAMLCCDLCADGKKGVPVHLCNARYCS
jgi:hypothetical protein